jgi:hypothetical protein
LGLLRNNARVLADFGAIVYQWTVTSYQLPVTSYQLSVTSEEVTSNE